MKKTVWISGLIGVLLMGFAAVASADLVYEQDLSEIDNYGFMSNIDGDLSADNFSIAETVSIQSIEWFGMYDSAGSGVSDTFDIKIYDMSGSEQFGAIGLTSAGKTASGVYDAYGAVIYKYEADVAGWELTAGEYLISISNGNSDYSDWYWADGTGGDGISYYLDSGIWTAEDLGADMAFALNSVPVPGSFSLLGLGLLLTAFLGRTGKE